MNSKQDYILTKLRNSRFPSFFFITMENENRKREEIIATSQTTWQQTMFSGEKPDNISEFEHAKICLITVVTDFEPKLTIEERRKIAKDKSKQVTVGVLNVAHVGKFELILDNKAEKIYLNGIE